MVQGLVVLGLIEYLAELPMRKGTEYWPGPGIDLSMGGCSFMKTLL